VKVPEVYWKYTTPQVLTMEYVPGIKINRIQQLDKLGVDRKRYVLYTSQPWPQFSVPTDTGCFWLT